MTLFGYGERLATVRRGRVSDAARALAWLLGGVATAVTPGGLAVAGLLFGVVATSVERAFAAGASFGIVVVVAGVSWVVVTGTPPPTMTVEPIVAIVMALLVPPVVAAVVRVLG